MGDSRKVDPNFEGKLVDSYGPLYKLFRPCLRPIGQVRNTRQVKGRGVGEMIHQSAANRRKKRLLTYNPVNFDYGLEHLPVEAD